METYLNAFLSASAHYAPNIIAAIVIYILGRWVASIAAKMTERILTVQKINLTFVSFVKNTAYYGIMTFVVIIILNKLGVETTSFLAILGAAGLAVALALQGSLSNFAAGVMIIFFQPFNIGDYIEAAGASGVGGVQGRVDEIQIFNTIMSNGNKKMIVPNSKITADIITIHADKKG
ncbi:MAG: mechanosensitive ion channel [Candidatus Saganbacteria bacterium]|nr:mechanosensitive ion channel [Candidatus Saganbacteria bacterium]